MEALTKASKKFKMFGVQNAVDSWDFLYTEQQY
jgi:hypothetical protein